MLTLAAYIEKKQQADNAIVVLNTYLRLIETNPSSTATVQASLDKLSKDRIPVEVNHYVERALENLIADYIQELLSELLPNNLPATQTEPRQNLPPHIRLPLELKRSVAVDLGMMTKTGCALANNIDMACPNIKSQIAQLNFDIRALLQKDEKLQQWCHSTRKQFRDELDSNIQQRTPLKSPAKTQPVSRISDRSKITPRVLNFDDPDLAPSAPVTSTAKTLASAPTPTPHRPKPSVHEVSSENDPYYDLLDKISSPVEKKKRRELFAHVVGTVKKALTANNQLRQIKQQATEQAQTDATLAQAHLAQMKTELEKELNDLQALSHAFNAVITNFKQTAADQQLSPEVALVEEAKLPNIDEIRRQMPMLKREGHREGPCENLLAYSSSLLQRLKQTYPEKSPLANALASFNKLQWILNELMVTESRFTAVLRPTLPHPQRFFDYLHATRIAERDNKGQPKPQKPLVFSQADMALLSATLPNLVQIKEMIKLKTGREITDIEMGKFLNILWNASEIIQYLEEKNEIKLTPAEKELFFAFDAARRSIANHLTLPVDTLQAANCVGILDLLLEKIADKEFQNYFTNHLHDCTALALKLVFLPTALRQRMSVETVPGASEKTPAKKEVQAPALYYLDYLAAQKADEENSAIAAAKPDKRKEKKELVVVKKDSIFSFFSTPGQRPPKIELLLKELLETTEAIAANPVFANPAFTARIARLTQLKKQLREISINNNERLGLEEKIAQARQVLEAKNASAQQKKEAQAKLDTLCAYQQNSGISIKDYKALTEKIDKDSRAENELNNEINRTRTVLSRATSPESTLLNRYIGDLENAKTAFSYRTIPVLQLILQARKKLPLALLRQLDHSYARNHKILMGVFVFTLLLGLAAAAITLAVSMNIISIPVLLMVSPFFVKTALAGITAGTLFLSATAGTSSIRFPFIKQFMNFLNRGIHGTPTHSEQATSKQKLTHVLRLMPDLSERPQAVPETLLPPTGTVAPRRPPSQPLQSSLQAAISQTVFAPPVPQRRTLPQPDAVAPIPAAPSSTNQFPTIKSMPKRP
jgi:hypothetical protein